MREESATADVRVAKIAARQHGIVSIAQIIAVGIGRSGVGRRVQTGRLHRVHHGVYAVGHAGLGDHGRWTAAVLACGTNAVLSHRSAAALWGLLPARAGAVDVSVAGEGGRRRQRGIRVHRSRTLTPEVTTRRQNIPVTAPARTIADPRRTARPELVRRAARQAAVLGIEIPEDLDADGTRSELERRFLRICRRYRIPPPRVNARVGGYLVDFFWPAHRLIVETDGYRYHRGRVAFEEDRARDVKLRMLGHEVIRFTNRQLAEDSAGVAGAVARLLKDPTG
jgi:very-short-patch-repair endonuclease